MKIDIYEPCDKAIKSMNRENVAAFGRMKLAKWDEVQIIRTVATVYRDSARKARERYYDVGFEAYLLMMAICGEEPVKAHKMAGKAITGAWVDEMLTEVDPLTQYSFYNEAERKAYRLAEAIEVAHDRNALIDRALKDWSRQIGQYAINITDYAVLQAMKDFGIEEAEWETERDEKVCGKCGPLDGRRFRVDEIPVKPHYGCRCRWKPIVVSAAKAD